MSWLSRIFGRRADTPTISPAQAAPPAAPIAPEPPPVVAAPSPAPPAAAPPTPTYPEPPYADDPVATTPSEAIPTALAESPAPEPSPSVRADEEPDAMTRFMAHQAHMQALHDRAVAAKQRQHWDEMVSTADALRVSATQADDRQGELQAYRLLATAHANLRQFATMFHCSTQAVVLARELHDADLPTDEYRLRTFATALRPHLIDGGDADTVQALTAAEALIDAP